MPVITRTYCWAREASQTEGRKMYVLIFNVHFLSNIDARTQAEYTEIIFCWFHLIQIK